MSRCPIDHKAYSMRADRDQVFDPSTDMLQMSAKAPIHRLLYPDGHVGWLVTGHAVAKKILNDPRFSARSEFKRAPVKRPGIEPFYGQPALPGWMVDMDPPEHKKYRVALTEMFSLRRLNLLKPLIEKIVKNQLDSMQEMGPGIDLVEHFALPIPSLAICELLGVPYENRKEFQKFSEALFSLKVSSQEATEAMDQLNDFFSKLIQQKKQIATDDIISELIASRIFSDEEIMGLGVLLLTAGHETTTNMLALGTMALLSNPSQLEIFKNSSALTDNAVEELLRYLTIFHFGVPRTPLVNVEMDGFQMAAGESITVLLPMANRDPGKFVNPNKLDITRSTVNHLAFGFGIHYCMGRNLARIEMQIGLIELFRRFPKLYLAAKPEEIKMNSLAGLYGVHSLPVAW